jgi:hypothetical protein
MGDIDAYRTSACHGLGKEIEGRVGWRERNLAALVKVVTNPRATVGLQNALAQRASASRASTPPRRSASPPAQAGPGLGGGAT